MRASELLRGAGWMALLWVVVIGPATAAEVPRPNVVIILADDLGYSDLGCYGSEIETPHLDALAAGGLRYTQFYNTGRCWPSRSALLSGYYPQQINRDPAGQRPAWAALLPQLLSDAGYHSYQSGKWHVDGKVLAGGFRRSYHVTDHDRYFAPKHHELDDRPLALPKPEDKYYATDAITDRALEWLKEESRERKNGPFFLYLAYISPHFPLHALSEDIARYQTRYEKGWDVVRKERGERIQKLGLVAGELSTPESEVRPPWNLKEEELQKRIGPGESGRAIPWSELSAEQRKFQAKKMAIHAAMIDRMDRQIGRVIEQLKQMQAFENTLILFASDNGASAEQIIRGDGHDPSAAPGSGGSYLGLGPGWSTVANAPFRRHKSWNHEGGISTPLVVHWPAGIKARGELRERPGHLVDIFPTLLELAGQTSPARFQGADRPPLAGQSLVRSFAHDEDTTSEPLYFKHLENRALRLGDWKIVASGAKADWELYDLKKDRAEMHNLAAEQPERVKELAAIWHARDIEYAKQGASGRVDKGKAK